MAHFVSWNVNGIRACHKNGFLEWLKKTHTDVVGLQEVRADVTQIPEDLAAFTDFHKAWFPAQKKGYSGVGILSRVAPLNVVVGMAQPDFDVEGRVLTAEFREVFFVVAYFPNSQGPGLRVNYKVAFCEAIHEFVNKLAATGKAVILTGDFNIAHQEIDLARPKENQETAGFLPEERAWMSKFLDSGWVDTYRSLNPDKVAAYSWWSMRTRARERNMGWRIDYHVVPERDRKRIIGADIHADVTGSDHCPVSLEFDAQL